MKRVVFHIDVNSAFLSWSAVKELEDGGTRDLRLIPSVVGGDEKSRHGIVLAKSIPAKKYGIQTGETLHSARLKCPELVSVRGAGHDYYSQKSNEIMGIVNNYSDRVSKYSIDECFVEYTGMERLMGEPVKTAYEIKDRIKKELGFTVNIGVGGNKLLAKMAGDFEKPDKVHVLFAEDIREKMWPLPVADLFMCGRQSVKQLTKMGIKTIGDLASTDISLLCKTFKSYGTLLWRYANGLDDSPVIPGEERRPPKSVSTSWTLPADVTDYAGAHKIILCLAETVCKRLRELNSLSGTISVFIKNTDFLVYGAQSKISKTDCTEQIYEKAAEIFDGLWKGEPLRLLGVRAEDFSPGDYAQLNIMETRFEKLKLLDEAIDEIRDRYGYAAVFRGSLWNERRKQRLGSAFTVTQ